MRLNQVTAPASNLDASVNFYQMLGLRLIVKSPHYARFELPRGEATFSLHVVEGPVARENAPQLYFECANVDFEVRRLKHAGIAIEHEPKAQSWLWYEAWLRDPAGNSICLFNAGENRRYPPWRIDAPPAIDTLHLVIREGEQWSLVKAPDEKTLRAFQESLPDATTALGPFDLFALLAMLEREWPETFLAHEEKIRAFVISDETSISF